ncbi:MAG: orotidine-5'-phosphate decarboxylase, partial [Bauldia litoralis]
MPARDRLIVALDVPDVDAAEALVTGLGDSVTFYKVGMQLIYAGGVDFARNLAVAGKKVFLDAKLLDIDNTVAHAVESIVRLGVTFATVHAYPKAMEAAVTARGDASLRLLGVTVLTSMDDADLADAG